MVTITAETVAAAAEKLLLDGKNPTQSAVRTVLGGGSYSTIGPLLHSWKESREEADELAELEIPEALANAGSELMARVWKIAMAEAQAGHDAIRKELLQAQAEIEAANQETADVAASLEADLAARDERIATLEADSARQADELRALNDRAITAERELAVSRERALAEEKRANVAEQRATEALSALVKIAESKETKKTEDIQDAP